MFLSFCLGDHIFDDFVAEIWMLKKVSTEYSNKESNS